MRCFSGINEILCRYVRILLTVRVDDHQLDLHFFGENAFDVYRGTRADGDPFLTLGKTGKVGGQLNKNTVAFNASDDARHRFSHGKARGALS